jgi:MSHA biogenesis protein MshJ
MIKLWRQYSERFNALKVRERVLILLGVVVCTAMVFDSFAFQPKEKRIKELGQQIVDARQKHKIAEALMQKKEVVGVSYSVKRTYRDALQARLDEVKKNMAGMQQRMVSPEHMAKLLEDMLASTRGLQLVSLRALPPKIFEPGGKAPILASEDKEKDKKDLMAEGESKNTEGKVFQHGFELTLQGTYSDLLEYLVLVEKLPWQMFWSRMTVQVDQSPKLKITITVQTLSLAKAWLVV